MKMLVQSTAAMLLLTSGQVVCEEDCCGSFNVTITGVAAELFIKEGRSWHGIYEEDGMENYKKQYKTGGRTKYLYWDTDRVWAIGAVIAGTKY